MDEQRFDDLARRVADAASTRRSAIKSLLGVFAGGALALTRARGIEAVVCRQGGSTCRENANCCSGTCLPARQFRDHRAHCQCQGTIPICGTRCCTGVTPACCPGNECADLDSDPQHCGTCGTVAETDRGETCCGGVPIQLGTDSNCSACGDDCTERGTGFHCVLGADGFVCSEAQQCGPQPTPTGVSPGPTITITCTVTATSIT